jgi:hypothetical protein
MMNDKDKAAFYIGAAIARDLESDEVDTILMSEGLDASIHDAKTCKNAIDKNIHNWVWGGPVFDWDSIKSKIDKIRGN